MRRCGSRPGSNSLFVNLLHFGDHVRPDDAWADFEHLDVALGQSRGPQGCGHTEGSFRNAVLGSVDRGGIGRNGRDEDNSSRALARAWLARQAE